MCHAVRHHTVPQAGTMPSWTWMWFKIWPFNIQKSITWIAITQYKYRWSLFPLKGKLFICPDSFILHPFTVLTCQNLITMDFYILNILLSCFKVFLKVLSLFCWYTERDVYGETHLLTTPLHTLVLGQKEFLGIPEICLKILFHHKVLSTKPKYIQNWKKQ